MTAEQKFLATRVPLGEKEILYVDIRVRLRLVSTLRLSDGSVLVNVSNNL